jgi:DnaJ-domain-containing protein 1
MELGYDTLAQQRADALVDLATNGGTKTDAEIVLHVRADGARLMTERLSLVT